MPDPRFLFTMPGFPRKLMSTFAGAMARLWIPASLRRPLWSALGKRLGVDPKTLPDDLRAFPTFLSFFTRPLPDGTRPIPEEAVWLSPSDGILVDAATLHPEGSFLMKGTPYSISEMLPGIALSEVENYQAFQIYLAPRDYHRFHAPCDLHIEKATTCPGDLLPVDPGLVRRSMRVLTKNRRILLHCRDNKGRWFGLLFVGALNVGQMRFCFDSTLGLSPLAPGNRSYGPPHTLSVGEELGRFEFGSTVVLFVPPDLECQLSLGDKCLARATRLFAPK
ncbi:MAG TPA: archaetidylserine decarboxylase [Planctomycetota bacterium]|nr:archaetidylserine decarboxylase [Planctomycetota bacterium]HJM39856.1 archaetidylserine decarboxylase [Planctomycetota bacterium]